MSIERFPVNETKMIKYTLNTLKLALFQTHWFKDEEIKNNRIMKVRVFRRI